jgi:hypothetical protein
VAVKPTPKVLGLIRALVALARPRLLPYVLLLVLAGYAWAHWDRALVVRAPLGLLAVLVAWTLLHAGTLWLNALLDRDEGPVLMGATVRPPSGTAVAAYVALALAVVVASLASAGAGLACAACAVLAVAYSHPATAWKGHPLGGPLVNVVGYGLLSPLAGFAVVGVPADVRTLLVWPLGALGILGTYLAAQAFQQDEDRARGYRTLVATSGPAVVLGAARVAIGLAAAGGMALSAAGWLPRACVLGAVGWIAVDRYLAAWAREPGGGSEARARGFAARMLGAGVLGIVLAFASYAVDSFAGRPVAGLGTVRGHPPDRPLLPPLALCDWERRQRE